jgi:type VI secretion system ImpM family protein
MTVVGMFGKLPTFGDFVSVGSGSPLHRGFERWLEDSNDVLGARRKELPKDPLGLMIRGEDSASLLVGMLVGSCDSVGRSFPLGLFHEVRMAGTCLAGMPLAMAADLGRLAGVARKARARGHHEVAGIMRDMACPADEELAIRSHAELHRLRIVRATLLLERVWGKGHGSHYGSDVIERACALSEERGGRAPLVLDGRAHTDIELMFLLATIDAMSEGRQPVAVFWDVRSHRVLFVLGRPDAGILALMVEDGQADRVWPLATDRPEVAQKAAEGLDAGRRALLDDPGSISAKDFLAAMAAACKTAQPQAAVSKEKRSLWRRRVP